ncbi:MAG: hypothetical protein ACOYMV_12775 [Verrucomicrobiia bacterium]|jgi:hypothetical protein
MSTVEQIETEIEHLSPQDMHRVADWLAEYRAQLWDKQIEEDAGAGKLDLLFEEAEKERQTDRLRDWPSKE